MQRLACLVLVLAAACSDSGPPTGAAMLSNLGVKAAATEPFEGPDASGATVMGWTVLFFEDAAGGDCKSGTVLAKIGIYTTQAKGSAPQAILQTGGISIVTDAPPMIIGNAAANMTAMGVGSIQGLVNIDEFHLTADAKHADRIMGTVSAGGYDANNAGVSLTGTFTAPICE